MEPAQPETRVRELKSARTRERVWFGVLVATTLLVGACDSVVGVPEDANRPARNTTPPAAIPSLTQTTTTGPPSSTLPMPPADAPPVGAVPGLPAAAPALQRWAADLRTDSTTDLQAKCWTIAPKNVADMYEGKTAILAALAQPGAVTEDGVVWKNRGTTVVADPNAIKSGYACPRVYPAGTEIGYNEADARHTVRRYLSRFVGTPLDPADKEGDYPLVCKAADWDPTGSGKPTEPPLANNPGKLTGVTKFADQEIRSERLRQDYLSVQVPVTNAAGVTQTRTFTLAETATGYCIGDVSS
ncbi:hypothetical protein [Nocardia arthritidis]|uniref:Uncharacterized protein n=1 Tax=Nocardia arthritidis TaxID=228602 RepID=A0A6G9Y4A7_9NOCA|nr:hypothetical protein [Nocardia arthritidis]QIS08058.1 hypothetical protein F5544_00625 [Nocardia arthritidis]